ncbi:DUF971 domain-containing protein [Aquisalimonas sp.]|uniref:DUF971 domain-containing protein n=1 Tax=Aquisalimonas sp. TaxID=1872621 RepID=UPI0025BA640E|nr:DUF971 domain-containing protein [Aquisalimonas sp.]
MPTPTELNLRQASKVLDVCFDDGSQFALSCEYLRVQSPSAEVKGHGPGQAVLQVNKEDVNITRIDPVGNYAVRLYFDDGHHTGLYTWDYLYELGVHQDDYWQQYLDALAAAGYQRRTEGSTDP